MIKFEPAYQKQLQDPAVVRAVNSTLTCIRHRVDEPALPKGWTSILPGTLRLMAAPCFLRPRGEGQCCSINLHDQRCPRAHPRP
jgi:hypothetical protein